jgi:hypothetical protein
MRVLAGELMRVARRKLQQQAEGVGSCGRSGGALGRTQANALFKK